MRIRFRFRAIPFVATVLLVALGIALGQWQDRRAAQKIALQQMLATRGDEAPLVLGPEPVEAGPLEYRHVRVTGRFLADWPVFLDNRPYQGHAGFYVLMPFRIKDSGMHVLVARGWAPRIAAEHDRLPLFDTANAEVTIEGRVRAGVGHIMQLGTPAAVAPRAIVQNLDAAQFGAASNLKMQPFMIEQTSAPATDDKLVRDWPAPALGVEKHQGYAFQWYALAVMALLFFLITGFRRGTKEND